MKRIFTILAAVLLTATVWAQAPEKMTYQAVLRDTDNKLLQNQTVGMQISILKSSADGDAIYVETQTPTTNVNGLVTIEIGTGDVVKGNFSTIDWGGYTFFIKTETDINGGTDYTITGTSQMLSVPYALYAKTAGAAKETQTLADVASLGNSVNAQIKDLSDPTDDQDAVTKTYVDKLIEELQIETGIKAKDFDGNIYKTVVIGTQRWMAENLRVTHYPDGTFIPNVTDDTEWSNLGDNNTDDAYCFYDTDSGNGALYTYAAAKNACPTGWHLPSDDEWKTLEMFLGMSQNEADKIKWRGTDEGTKLKAKSGWNNNGNGNDDYGFTALPEGYRNYESGLFEETGNYGRWWSSTENSDNSDNAYLRDLSYEQTKIYRKSYPKSTGSSVRCVKD